MENKNMPKLINTSKEGATKRAEVKTKEREKMSINKTMKHITTAIITMQLVMLNSLYVFANEIKDSQIAKGTEKLIADLTTWLMVLAPIIGGLLILYFFIRRSAADEMDQKKWNNRITTAIISVIGAVLASATLNLIIGYYM
ncbi:MAG: Mbov_0395 family pilin-like conjugal transfer protein [Alkaliphilus sp.]